jgi:hypothetical protein
MDDPDRSWEVLALRSAHDIVETVAARVTQPPFFELRRRQASVDSRRIVLAAAAVAVIIAAGGLFAQQMTSTPATPLSAATSSPALSDPPGSVAWAALPATHPSIETHTVSEQPDPSVAEAAPACTADALAASSSLDGAGGQWVLSVAFRNTGTQPCHLTGAPTWAFQVGSSTVRVPQTLSDGTGDYGRPVLLDGGNQAVATAMWATQDCSSSEPAAVTVTASGTDTALEAGPVKASPVCSGAGGAAAEVRVSTVAPANGWRPAREASDWAGTVVLIEPPAEVTAGSVAQYGVVFTAPRDISLATCPDYTVQLTAQGADTSSRESFGLNCADVPYSSPTGGRELPKGTQVSFALRVHVPADLAGKYVKLVWKLDVPEEVSAAIPVQVS